MISTSKTGILVYGELAKEPEFKRLQNGSYLMKLNVRYDSEKNEQGKWLGKFIDVNVWRVDVDLWDDMLHKGDCIIASGKKVEPLGYTSRNHCPFCLWSLHVDENPGDRACECGGEMGIPGLMDYNIKEMDEQYHAMQA